MRLILVVLVTLVGCCTDDDPVEITDAEPATSLDVPIGQRCDVRRGLVCGAGVLGACIDSVCVPQCYSTRYPRCDAPLVEHHAAIDTNNDVCYCAR